jgi:hypothetical protein
MAHPPKSGFARPHGWCSSFIALIRRISTCAVNKGHDPFGQSVMLPGKEDKS